MNSIFSFILVLGILVFVHEFGHFIIAKLFRIKVLKFSLGFGPKLFSKQYGDTEYIISALPLGGFVKMLGEQPNEEVSAEESKDAFSSKKVWQRFFVVFAGPLFNLLFAVFIFFAIFQINGIPHPLPGTEIGQVTPDSPADKSGILSGDIILSINGIETVEWQDVSTMVRQSNGASVTLSIDRNGQRLTFTSKPEKSEVKNLFGEVVETRYLLGITKSDKVTYKKTSIGNALIAGFEQAWLFIYLTIMSLVKIFQRIIPASEIGGPIMIASMAGQQMSAGWSNLFSFMGILSVNLGIINLFPIPILDGGHLVFFTIEALRRKPLSLQAQEILQQIGIVLLASLMIFVFYNDFARILTKG